MGETLRNQICKDRRVASDTGFQYDWLNADVSASLLDLTVLETYE